MEFLKNTYRELLENWNFSKENRLVFEEAPKPEPEKVEGVEGGEEKMEDVIKKIETGLKTLVDKHGELKKAYEKGSTSQEEQKALDNYFEKRQEISKRIDDFNSKENPEIKAVQAIHTDIQKLITDVSGHAEKGTLPNLAEETKSPGAGKKGLETGTQIEKLKEGRQKAKNAIEKTIIEKFKGTPIIDPSTGKIEELDMATLIKKPAAQTLINHFLNSLPEDRIKELEKNPNLPATKEEAKFIKDAFCKATGIEEIDDKDDKEIAAIKKLTGDKLGVSLAEMLSRTHSIVEKDGKITIDDNIVENAAGLKPYLPIDMQAAFEAAIKEGADTKTLTGLELLAKGRVDVLANLQKVLDNVGESKEGGKKMGAIEGLMALLQLLPTIMEALKKGDFSIVNEMMADFNKGENPAKKLSESKKGYDKILKEKTPSLDTLLSVYEDPSTNNEAANDLFCEGKTEEEIKTDPLGKYRLMAKPAIQAQLAQKLGLTISKMEANEMGTKVEAMTRGQKKFSINFYQKGGKLVANILPYIQEKVEGGGTTWVEGTESKDVEGANWEKMKNELIAPVAKKE